MRFLDAAGSVRRGGIYLYDILARIRIAIVGYLNVDFEYAVAVNVKRFPVAECGAVQTHSHNFP